MRILLKFNINKINDRNINKNTQVFKKEPIKFFYLKYFRGFVKKR